MAIIEAIEKSSAAIRLSNLSFGYILRQVSNRRFQKLDLLKKSLYNLKNTVIEG